MDAENNLEIYYIWEYNMSKLLQMDVKKLMMFRAREINS